MKKLDKVLEIFNNKELKEKQEKIEKMGKIISLFDEDK